MFTSRSASARQTFPSVLGRSSINTVNSLVTGIVGTSFRFRERRMHPGLGWNGDEIIRPRHPLFKTVRW